MSLSILFRGKLDIERDGLGALVELPCPNLLPVQKFFRTNSQSYLIASVDSSYFSSILVTLYFLYDPQSEANNVFEIEKVDISHVGVYRCSARSGENIKEAFAFLSVNDHHGEWILKALR